MPIIIGKLIINLRFAYYNRQCFLPLLKDVDMKPKPIKEDDQELMKTIGRKIKDLRKDRKIGYIDLADEIGISRNALNLIENGRVYFNFSTLLQILRYFETTTDDFFKDLN